MAKGIKTDSREYGTPNRLTKELRQLLKNLLAKEIETIPAIMEKLDPKERLEIVAKLLPYAIPKVESVNFLEGEGILDDWN